MHEAGLADAVAGALRREGIGAGSRVQVRVLVRGGQAEPADFDAAFRLHLAAAIPELDPAAVELCHLPVARLCVRCGGSYQAASAEAPCPACGGSGFAVPAPEQIEIELVRPDEPAD